MATLCLLILSVADGDVTIHRNRVSWCRDPDGNEVELYVDNPEVGWHTDLAWMEAPVKPLAL